MADPASTEDKSQPSGTILSNPQVDADRIRLKRLAKLQNQSASSSSSPSTSASTAPTPPPATKSIPKPSAKRALPEPSTPAAKSPVPRKQTAPSKFNLAAWEAETITTTLNITLDRTYAERKGWSVVWLKELATELHSGRMDDGTPLRVDNSIVDQLLIARLELDPNGMSDDPEILTVTASLPPNQTVFEYLVGCWRRANLARSALHKKGYNPADADIIKAYGVLDQLRDLLVSYAGLTLQDPSMFPQPTSPANSFDRKPLGPQELLLPLLSLSSSNPLGSSGPPTALSSVEVEPFIIDLARRFEEDGLEDVLGPVVLDIAKVIQADTGGLMGSASGAQSWRAGVGAFEALVAVKSVAAMITRLAEWSPAVAIGPTIEFTSLIGPLARLGVFAREWPSIAQAYFSDPQKRTRADVDSSNSNLRSTLKNVQQSLFNILSGAVRAGPQPREAVLNYLGRAVQLNLKRGGTHVDPASVASDGYMINLQAVLLRFAEPFLDAKFTKLDRVDPLYYSHSKRLDISDETRIKASAPEAKAFHDANQIAPGVPAPNFISDIFFLLAAYNHYGLVRTITSHDELSKHVDEIQRRLDQIEGDTSWQGTPVQAQAEAAIKQLKDQRSKVHSEIFAYQVQLLDPELIDRTIGFTTFSMAWVIRLIDPAKTYPATTISLPLPKEVPEVFKMLPEYFIEDIVEFYLFIVRHNPESLELAGKKELLEFILIFLSSTWYINNPYLKAKLVQIMFYGTIAYKRERTGVLGPLLNSHPMALKYLLPALMNFYVEVEQTGASSQFYDKFEARRNISFILKVIWTNPSHREALQVEAKQMERFVRFANLLMNDATYLLDESLGKLSEIHVIQLEMKDQQAWAARDPNERKERERLLQTLESAATSYTTLGKSTLGLLKEFTAEATAPFMSPELVDRLAAMLNYNLDVLAGPKCANLNVENREKYRFKPRELLADVIQVYLNLCEQPEFIHAVAGEGRSYKKELFEKVAGIARFRSLKSEDEIEKLRMFVVRVEESKASIEAEDDLGEIPDEFLDPILYSIMRDPVFLPTSKITTDRSSIKAHLLSDGKDPFNRQPLSLDDVLPNTELKARIDAFLIERRKKPLSGVDELVKFDETASGGI